MSIVEEYPVVSDKPLIQAAYIRYRREGSSHSIAEICAFKTPPGTKNTDRAFFEGKYGGQDLEQLPAGMQKRARERYRKMTGRDIPQGSVYISQLADGPGDPKAYFDSVHDIKKRCIETGAACEALGIAGAEVMAPKPKVKYAPRLLQRRLKSAMANPENQGKKPRELAEAIIDKHSYNAEA